MHLPEGVGFGEEVGISKVAETVKINGAGIYNVMRRSCMKAVLRGEKVILGADMEDSVKLEFAKENKTL